ncbi:MAG TPA: hypothetical protein PKD70_04735, partial [Saprospiraceae bacterium]|nr:hypothetical protein [Saprospiraceae bacterium]HMP13163.1 hypothetical protein [Saprospiraceae bacterium]
MGKTNFTFVRPLIVVLLAWIGLGMQNLAAQQGNCGQIIANSQNYTIPSCVDEVTFFYSFNVVGVNCPNVFDINDLEFDVFGELPGNVFFSYVEDAGNATVFVEYGITVSAADANDYVFSIRYGGLEGVSVAPIINILAPGNDDTPFIAVNNTNPTLPACETTGTA